MLTYSLLLQMLVEAEARRDDATFPQDVRDRSAETAALCERRIAQEGMTRAQLEEYAAAEDADAEGTRH